MSGKAFTGEKEDDPPEFDEIEEEKHFDDHRHSGGVNPKRNNMHPRNRENAIVEREGKLPGSPSVDREERARARAQGEGLNPTRNVNNSNSQKLEQRVVGSPQSPQSPETRRAELEFNRSRSIRGMNPGRNSTRGGLKAAHDDSNGDEDFSSDILLVSDREDRSREFNPRRNTLSAVEKDALAKKAKERRENLTKSNE